MMRARWGAALGVAALLGGFTVQSFRDIAAARTLDGGAWRELVSPPAALLPPGTRQAVEGRALDSAARATLRDAVWRAPLDQHLANLVYVDMIDRGVAQDRVARQAALLAALGWRDTAAQQNLILRDELDARFAAVLDRADALLRRQRLPAQANQTIALMEAAPLTAVLVTRRLAERPPWRSDYLVATAQAAPRAFLAIRAGTLRALMNARQPIERREIAPVLSGLVAAGQGAAAYRLWNVYARRSPTPGAELLADRSFAEAAARGERDEAVFPFEWQLASGVGYSVDAGQGDGGREDGAGLRIDWDGRGLPVFASQWVPVEAGRAYLLAVRGQANATTLPALLRPTWSCAGREIAFDAENGQGGGALFRSGPLPRGCAVAQLALAARPRDNPAPVSAVIARVSLRPIG